MFKKLRKKILIAGLALSATSAPIITPILTTPPAIAAEVKNGIYTESGNKVLYVNGKKQTGTGNKICNGKTYYIKDSKVAGEIVTNLSGWYEIHSAVKGKTNYVIDVNGAAFQSGSATGKGAGNIQVWEDNDSIAQRFFFTHKGNGIYTIGTGTGDHKKSVDVVSGQKNANIRQWDINNAVAQKFIVIKNFEGSLNFINVSTGQALDIEGNDSFENGRNIWDYPYMFGNDKGQNFTVTPICKTGELPFNPSNIKAGWYFIKPKYNTKFLLDVNKNSSADKANVQLFGPTGSNAQKFYIKNLGNGFYSILTGSSNAKSAVDAGGDKGNVHQWTYDQNNDYQKYKVYKNNHGGTTSYSFVNVKTGKALDVAGNSQYENYRNIQNYQFVLGNKGLSGIEGQEYILEPTTEPSYKNAIVTAEMFGAKADDSGDDTSAINNTVKSGAKEIVLKGTYVVNGTIDIQRNDVTFSGGGTIKLPNNATAGKVSFLCNGKNINFTNLKFKGNYNLVKNKEEYNSAVIRYYTKTTDPKGVNNFNSKVTNCTFANTGRRAICIASANHNAGGKNNEYPFGKANMGSIPRVGYITISNNNFQTNSGITVCTAGGSNLTITNNTFNDSGLEHITLDWGTMNSTVTGNKFYGFVGGCGAIGVDTARNDKIYNNTFATTSAIPHVRINDQTGKSSNIGVQNNARVTSRFYGTWYKI